MSDDKPTPRPTIPSPAALAARMQQRPVAAPAVVAHSESARFGRVDEEGRVFVTVGDEEREVGSYPGATPDEALQYFARKYDELAASADLLAARLANPDVSAKEVADGLATLKDHVGSTGVVGDVPALLATVERVEAGLEVKRAHEAEQRAAARAEAAEKREAVVAEAERIAAQPPGSTQWKTSGERMRALLDEWKAQQRSGAKLDKTTETALWQRFSHARNSFDKARRAWFADLEVSRADARTAKEALVAEAEELATSTDWAPTARAFKQLMDRWRAAGRASRAEDDALWERFRSAQDAFFQAKDRVAAAEDEEFRSNLTVKEELLTEAEALLPVTDVEAAKSALRGIQDRWERAGKVLARTWSASRSGCAAWRRRCARPTSTSGAAPTPRSPHEPGRWWSSSRRPSRRSRPRSPRPSPQATTPPPTRRVAASPLSRSGSRRPGRASTSSVVESRHRADQDVAMHHPDAARRGGATWDDTGLRSAARAARWSPVSSCSCSSASSPGAGMSR